MTHSCRVVSWNFAHRARPEPYRSPPNAVIVALSLFLTAFVMGPALQRAYDLGIRPLMNNEISVEQAFERASEPLKVFMQKNVREKDLMLFSDLSREPPAATPEEMSLRILVPAFMISELKRAFEIGFLLFLPFLIIDLVVAWNLRKHIYPMGRPPQLAASSQALPVSVAPSNSRCSVIRSSRVKTCPTSPPASPRSSLGTSKKACHFRKLDSCVPMM